MSEIRCTHFHDLARRSRTILMTGIFVIMALILAFFIIGLNMGNTAIAVMVPAMLALAVFACIAFLILRSGKKGKRYTHCDGKRAYELHHKQWRRSRFIEKD